METLKKTAHLYTNIINQWTNKKTLIYILILLIKTVLRTTNLMLENSLKLTSMS